VSTTEWYPPSEAARRLKVNVETIYDGCTSGSVPHRRVGRALRIPAWWVNGDDLERDAAPEGTGATLTVIAHDDEAGRRENTG
jgi:excisionase family DNA binding protein